MNTPSTSEPSLPSQELTELIESARKGDEEALNLLIALSRVVIREQAGNGFPSAVARRVDPSDVVQETLLEASRDFHDFQGKSGKEWRAWLERVLANNLVECVRRHVDAEKRSVTREYSCTEGGNTVPANDSPPDQRAIRAEFGRCVHLVQSKLEADQKRILEMRYWQGASLSEIASSMKISKSSAVRLLRKSLQMFRQSLSNHYSVDELP